MSDELHLWWVIWLKHYNSNDWHRQQLNSDLETAREWLSSRNRSLARDLAMQHYNNYRESFHNQFY